MQEIKRDLSSEILWIIVQDCFSVLARLEQRFQIITFAVFHFQDVVMVSCIEVNKLNNILMFHLL